MIELLAIYFDTLEKFIIKKCAGCLQEKAIIEFEWRNDTQKWRHKCKKCRSKDGKKYWDENKEKGAIRSKQYRKDNKEIIKVKKQLYYENNKERILEKEKKNRKIPGHKEKSKEYNKKYRIENKEKLEIKEKEYRNTPEHKEKQNIYNTEYRTNPKNKIKRNIKHKRRFQKDINYKLNHNMHSAILNALYKNNGSKNGQSMLKYLPYSIEELKLHIEKLFSHPNNLTQDGKIWMNWNNWGRYDSKTWDDNDPLTWKWQIDHIIPRSLFKYSDMSCQEFQNCWALSNLRPLSAKQNQLDGATKVRHRKNK